MKMLILFASAVSVLAAQSTPPLSNARLETRAFSGDLDSQLRSTRPTWFGYQIKTVQRDESCCWSDGSHGCWLEQSSRHGAEGVRSTGPVHLEGSSSAAVLFRVANNHIEKVQVFSMACPLDAGGLTFVWLAGVSAEASLKELRGIALSTETEHLTDNAIFAIANHEDAQADVVLNELSEPNQPEKTREKVAFWLGASRGASGVRTLQRMLKEDPAENVRDKVVFALSISKDLGGVETLIRAAKMDPSPHVRGQAIFWLAQKAGKLATAAIVDAIENDPNAEVKKRAVFALSQLPKDDGVPRLIEVARTQTNPEVRKQAFFWLGQSGDPRALSFIEQVLAK
jgi:HEAT repeat protein